MIRHRSVSSAVASPVPTSTVARALTFALAAASCRGSTSPSTSRSTAVATASLRRPVQRSGTKLSGGKLFFPFLSLCHSAVRRQRVAAVRKGRRLGDPHGLGNCGMRLVATSFSVSQWRAASLQCSCSLVLAYGSRRSFSCLLEESERLTGTHTYINIHT
jgi:hypothetical protein